MKDDLSLTKPWDDSLVRVVDLSGRSLAVPVIDGLKTIHDPEIDMNVFDLGLIYSLEIDETGNAAIEMTVTRATCPVADMLANQAKEVTQAVDGINKADVRIVFNPPWTQERLSEDARLALDIW